MLVLLGDASYSLYLLHSTVSLALVAASACTYLAFQVASLLLPVLMRLRVDLHSWIFPASVFFIILVSASQSRRPLREVPR
jgi:peptidoglycan/LPS O-acetylase OafA/YrhL